MVKAKSVMNNVAVFLGIQGIGGSPFFSASGAEKVREVWEALDGF